MEGDLGCVVGRGKQRKVIKTECWRKKSVLWPVTDSCSYTEAKAALGLTRGGGSGVCVYVCHVSLDGHHLTMCFKVCGDGSACLCVR